MWFSGFHSDVGGSYSESEAGLSKVSFEWILVEGQKASAKKKSSTRSQSR